MLIWWQKKEMREINSEDKDNVKNTVRAVT